MKQKIKLLTITLLVMIGLNVNSAFGQATTGNNTYAAASYLGWTTSNTLPFKLNGTQYLSLTTAGDFDITNTGNGITLAGNKLLFTKGSNTNLCVGITAGNAQGTAQGDNTFVGYQSGYNTNGNIAALTALYNTFIGSNSAFTNTGSCNNAHGYQALYKNTSGYANVAFGVSASYSNTTGAYNIAIGDSSLQTNTTGGLNTVMGYKALYSSTTASNNSAYGYKALFTSTTATPNDAFGHVALYSNTSGFNNSAFGDSCMFANTTGTSGAAVGYKAMRNNTTGGNNMAFGTAALATNTTGAQNAAIGFGALTNNTTANGNVGIGYEALQKNKTGAGNVGIGVVAGQLNVSGIDNTFVGDHAGSVDTSNYNTAIGGYAGNTIISGDSNTFVGYTADASTSTFHNCGAFGYGATATASRMIRIGNSKITVIQGQVGFTTSDGRFKTNVQENVKGLEFIRRLRPVTYQLQANALDNFMRSNIHPITDSAGNSPAQPDNSFLSTIQSGLIAQEVEKAASDAGFSTNIIHHPANNNDPYAISYEGLVVPLIKAVQEQQKMIDSLQNQINQITSVGGRKQNNSGDNKNGVSINVELNNVNAVVLNEAVPNPFAEQTVISYTIPSTATLSQILFYDSKGNLFKSVDIKTSGKGQLNVFANDLTSGMYSYTLIVDGKVIDTKKMMKQ